MARLVIKNGYIKGGGKTAAHLSHLVKYIATRDGVEKVGSGHEHWYATKSQQQLIRELLRRFPDSRESLEYEDYCQNPSRGNASEFITITLEQNLHHISDNKKYLDYIAGRPRVEKIDTHGLFTAGDAPLSLSAAADEVAAHTGNVWTPIISLRREDAEKFGFASAFAWKALVTSKAMEIADSLKIHPNHFRWYAAFHNESHHPHIHMVCYSVQPREGYLTRAGIQKMKSALAAEIFRQELIPLYSDKTLRRENLKEQSAAVMREMTWRMQRGMLRNEKVERLLAHLADRLQYTAGKKQYGYLKADLKNVVDEIVDELARDERVAAAYQAWKETKGLIDSVYSDQPREDLPLSRCGDFKSIRNMVIREAVLLMEGAITFEDAPSVDAALPDAPAEDDTPPALSPAEDAAEESDADHGGGSQNGVRHGNGKRPGWWTDEYKLAKQYLYGDDGDGIGRDFEEALALFRSEAESGNPLAMCDLARMYVDGLGVEADADTARQWYAKGLVAFRAAEEIKPWKYTQYRIGKMCAAGLGTEQNYEQAARWLTLAADEGYKYAEYSLGGLYHRGNGVEQNLETAFALYTRSADQGFPYASFEAGKMLRDGTGCAKDTAAADQRFAEAFHGFVSLENQSRDDKLQYRLGWMLANGVGTEQDIPRAKAYLEKPAAVGNPFACYQLAKLILSDEQAPLDEVERALAFLRQAVESENPHAAYFLGRLYETGRHVPTNEAEAVRLYTLAAERDNDCAAYRLGRLYLGGKGILKDMEKALRWLNFAAQKKNQFSQYALGVLYLRNENIPKDAARAIGFLKAAAGQGSQFAQYRLGKIYLTGVDAPKDVDAAVRYLTASAEQGNQFALYALGKLYLLGKDVPKDKEAAVKWFTLSAAQGNEYARFFLNHMDSFRDPSVMLAATRLLHHAGRVFADNAPPARSPAVQQVDRKLRRKMREKKMAQGHARDGHEQAMSTL